MGPVSTSEKARHHLTAILGGGEAAAAQAAMLLSDFGSMAAVVAGGRKRLLNALDGDIAAVERVGRFRSAILFLLRERVAARPILSDWRRLNDYLRVAVGSLSIETVRVLHLDTRNQLLCDDELARGTVDTAPVYVRELIARALEVGSTGLILVHNHPSGDPSPSRADIDITRSIIAAGRPLDISVLDHLIVGAGRNLSMRAKGLI